MLIPSKGVTFQLVKHNTCKIYITHIQSVELYHKVNKVFKLKYVGGKKKINLELFDSSM